MKPFTSKRFNSGIKVKEWFWNITVYEKENENNKVI